MEGDRIACQVLFCKRTASAAKFAGEEIICGKCWKMISAKTKEERRRIRSRSKRIDRLLMRRSIIGKTMISEQVERLTASFNRRIAAIWEKCKAEANEVAAGIRG
jgi:hypothetical protein